MKTSAKKITPAVIGVLRRRDGKYLMTDRIELDEEDKGIVFGDDFWQLPGGGLEVGETVEDAVVREMKEETGLDVEVVSLLPKIHTSIRPYWHGLLISYLLKMNDESQEVVLNHESSRFQWFTADEIQSLKSFEETAEIVRSAEAIAQLVF